MRPRWYLFGMFVFFTTAAWAATTGLQVVAVPEPVTMLLLGCGLVGLAGYGRKRTT